MSVCVDRALRRSLLFQPEPRATLTVHPPTALNVAIVCGKRLYPLGIPLEGVPLADSAKSESSVGRQSCPGALRTLRAPRTLNRSTASWDIACAVTYARYFPMESDSHVDPFEDTGHLVEQTLI